MKKYCHQFKAMGSPCKLVFYANTDTDSGIIIENVIAEITRLENKYSRYRDDSVTTKINNIAKLENPENRVIRLDKETAELLDYADVAYGESDGLFDITSGVFRRVWDFKSDKLPTEKQIASIKRTVGWHKVSWKHPELRFLEKDMEIDFGGYVKEYAVDKAVAVFKKLAVTHAYVELGGDIGIVGPQADGSAWNIGIRNPAAPETAIATIELYKGAIASSGDYERFMLVDGKRYCHIINPKTGWPVSYWSAVSVVADHCLIAGTASTITILMQAQGGEWLNNLGLRSVRQNKYGKISTSRHIISADRDMSDSNPESHSNNSVLFDNN